GSESEQGKRDAARDLLVAARAPGGRCRGHRCTFNNSSAAMIPCDRRFQSHFSTVVRCHRAVDLTAARRGRPARWLFLARLCATARDWTPGLAGATTKTSAAAETPAVALGDKTPKKRVEGGAP